MSEDDMRDAELNALYRQAARDEPPAELDGAILAAARREVGARPQSLDGAAKPTRNWRVPLGLAATLVLGVSLGTAVLREKPSVLTDGGRDLTAAPAAAPATTNLPATASPAESAPQASAGAPSATPSPAGRSGPAAGPAAKSTAQANAQAKAKSTANPSADSSFNRARESGPEKPVVAFPQAGASADKAADTAATKSSDFNGPPPAPAAVTRAPAPAVPAPATPAPAAPAAPPAPVAAYAVPPPSAPAAAPAPAPPTTGGLLAKAVPAAPAPMNVAPAPVADAAQQRMEANATAARRDSAETQARASAAAKVAASPVSEVDKALSEIRAQTTRGELDAARAALARFRQRFPDFVLPEDLRLLLDPPP